MEIPIIPDRPGYANVAITTRWRSRAVNKDHEGLQELLLEAMHLRDLAKDTDSRISYTYVCACLAAACKASEPKKTKKSSNKR